MSVARPSVHDNLFFSANGSPIPTGQDPDSNPVYANPQFTSPGDPNYDYTLLSGSPFLTTMGGQPFATDQGPRANPASTGPTPSITSFGSSATSLATAGSVTLSWTVLNATRLTINNGVDDVTGLTSKLVNVPSTTTFVLTAEDDQGHVATSSITVTVGGTPGGGTGGTGGTGTGGGVGSTPPPPPPPPTIGTISATPNPVLADGPVTISWTGVQNAVSLRLDTSDGKSINVTGLDGVTLWVSAGTTFTLTATNAAGVSVQVTATVAVTTAVETAQNIRYRQIRVSDRHGATHKVQMTDGSGSAGRTVKRGFDGSLVDNGIAISSAPDQGAANAYALTLTPAIAPVRGDTLIFQVSHTNTGASTLALNGYVPVAIKKKDGNTDLQAGDWTAGQMVEVTFDGTKWQWTGGGLTGTDNGLIGSGGTPGGLFPYGSWYGQVPRGKVDGNNRTFTLDYTLASPFTLLHINEGGQKPPRDGPNPNPNPDYAIAADGYTLTMRYAPKTTDWFYIWYFAGSPVAKTTGPTPTTSSLIAYLVWAHYPNVSSTAWGGGAGFNDTLSLFSPHFSWFNDNSQWDKRTDVRDLHSPFRTVYSGIDEAGSLYDGSMYLLIANFHVGSGAGPYSPPDTTYVYDAYILETKTDGSVVTWRPTAYSVNESDGPVVNPQFAIDGDPNTWAEIKSGGYGIVVDGTFLNLHDWQPVAPANGNVDLINGGGNTSGGTAAPGAGVGVTGNTASAALISADMSHGYVGSGGSYGYPGPLTNSLPAGTQALQAWGNLYPDVAGNPATNTQVAVKDVQLWWYNTATHQWVNGFGPTDVFDGGYFNTDLSGTQIAPIAFTTLADGSRAFQAKAGEAAHIIAPFPRVAVDATKYGGMVVVAKAKLVPINPTGTDDTATAKILFDMGASPYASTTAAPGTEPPTVAGGALKYVTPSWQSFAATDMSQAALTANPPPVDLTNLNPTSGGGTGGGTTGGSSPGVPAGYSLVYSEDFSGTSLPSPWGLGYYFNTNVPSSAVNVSGNALHLTWNRGDSDPDVSVSTSTTFKYGYFEARMKWNTQVGAWPAFWLIPTNGSGNTGEMDIFEGEGADAATYFGTIHEWNGSTHLWQNSPNDYPEGVDFNQWHTYGLKWEAGGVFTWYLDGNPIHSVTASGPIPGVFDAENCFIILSMQEGANWSPGNLSGVSASSLTLDVDYVRVYQQ